MEYVSDYSMRLAGALASLTGMLADQSNTVAACLANYLEAVDAWLVGVPPESARLVSELAVLNKSLNRQIEDVEAKQGEHTYSKAKAKIDRLLQLKEERALNLRIKVEIGILSEELNTQAAMVSAAIRKKVQTLLDRLQTPMNVIYKRIQGSGAIPIRLELPAEDDTNQQRLNLVIDFSENRTGVQPGGYLSDSQIHSLALAFRLAAIKQFNSAAPIGTGRGTAPNSETPILFSASDSGPHASARSL